MTRRVALDPHDDEVLELNFETRSRRGAGQGNALRELTDPDATYLRRSRGNPPRRKGE